MLKRTLSQVLLVSIGFACSVISLANGETFKSLTVTGTAKINHLHVLEKTHLDGHLDVEDSARIANHLYVGGTQEIKGHLNVNGNEHIGGKLTVDDNGIFEQKLIVEGDGIFKQKLIVEEDAIFKDDLIVEGDGSIKGKLNVTGDGDFESDLDVDGLLHAKANLEVDGDASIKGNEYVGKNLNVGGDETVGGNLTVKNVNITQNLNVGNNETVGGNLLISGNESISGSLNVGESVNISENLNVGGNENIGGNLNVSGNECIGGDLCVNQSISSQNLNTNSITIDQLTVNNNAQIQGTLYVNEIDPLNSSQTTHFSGNVALDRCKKLFVNEINPAPKDSTQCCLAEDNGVICFSGNAAVDPQHTLLVNFINPVQRTECGDCLPDENGTTCFSGNVAVDQDHTLLVNWIDPVKFDETCLCCAPDDTGVTCFSGNAAINPDRALWVNEINPVAMDQSGNCIPNDQGITCFSGNVGLDPARTLFVNEINPVAEVNGICVPDDGPCAFTNFSGNINIKNSHLFGQLNTINTNGDPIILDCLEHIKDYDDYLYNTDVTSFSLLTGFPVTRCQPVLRLNFNDTTAAALGAWVKINFFGTAHLNSVDCNTCASQTDIFTELYFFVGAGNKAPCSSLVGSLSNPKACSGFNTLTSFGCDPSNVFSAHHPFIPLMGLTKTQNPFLPRQARGPLNLNSFKWGTSLFEFMPTAEGFASVSVIGTTVSSTCDTTQFPNSVDIALLAMMPSIQFDTEVNQFFFFHNGTTVFLDRECPFYIDNITIFYEIISPNLDPKNPPCFPDPLLDCNAYDRASFDLVSTYTLAIAAAEDSCEYPYIF